MSTFILDEKTYNLEALELDALKEANVLIEQNNNLYALDALYNAFYINILRRVEFYNKNKLIKKLNKKQFYKKDEDNILNRWQNFSSSEILKSIKHLKIINKLAYNIFLSFHNFKINTSAQDEIKEEYLKSFFILLKEELFNHQFINEKQVKLSYKRRLSDKKEIKRREEDLEKQKRRESDKENIINEEEKIIINTKNISPINVRDLFVKENTLNQYKEEEKDRIVEKIIYI